MVVSPQNKIQENVEAVNLIEQRVANGWLSQKAAHILRMELMPAFAPIARIIREELKQKYQIEKEFPKHGSFV